MTTNLIPKERVNLHINGSNPSSSPTQALKAIRKGGPTPMDINATCCPDWECLRGEMC